MGNKCGTLAGKLIWPIISTRATVQKTWSHSSNSHQSSHLGLYGIGKFTFSGAFVKFSKTTIGFVISVRLSVRPYACNNSAPTGRIFMKFGIRVFFETLSRKFNFHWNLTKKDTLHAQQCILLNTPRSVLLRIKNISEKNCRENQNTHFRFNKFFRKPCRW